MTIRIKGGRIIDPSVGRDEVGDLVISGKTIEQDVSKMNDETIINAEGLWVTPGLIDAHVHLREPGQEQKEDIETGLRAAAKGGFTAVLPMPNTVPPNDSPKITRMMIEKAARLGGTRIYPIAAVTEARLGNRLSKLSDLSCAGAVAFSDDGSAVADDQVMEQALMACLDLGIPLAQHAEDPLLSKDGVIHEGKISRMLNLPGWPEEAEDRIIARDIDLAEKTGAHVHFSHVSTLGAVKLIRNAKKRGLTITAEVTPHHLLLTDQAAVDVGPLAKVNPPLRPQEHVDAVLEALVDGTIDIVATDHAPHTKEDKQGGFKKAAFGMVGLELAVPLLLLLVNKGILTPMRMVEAMSTLPARIFHLKGGTLAPQSVADVTLIDPNRPYTIEPNQFCSKGHNTPFSGWKVPGRATGIIVDGAIIQSH